MCLKCFNLNKTFFPKSYYTSELLMTDKPRDGAHTTEDNVLSKISIESAIKNK